MSSKKPKLKETKVGFQSEWEINYFVINQNEKAICLICRESVFAKKYNIERHYESMHKKKYALFEKELREEKLNELKKKLKAQQNVFCKPREINASTVKVSYVLSQMIAKSSKPFSEGDFIKDCLLTVSEITCPEKKQLFANISLGRTTVAERINELAFDLSQQLVEISKKFVKFSIAIDESNDIRDTAQLAIFIRGVNEDFLITEELLDLSAMHDTCKGIDIFNKVK